MMESLTSSAFGTENPTIPVQNLDEANTKAKKWKRVAQHSTFAALAKAVDLSVHPSAKYASFPGLTPFEILHEKDVMSRLVSIPSTTVTTLVSALFGTTLASLFFLGREHRRSSLANCVSAGSSAVDARATGSPFLTALTRRLGVVLRVLLAVVISVLYVRFLRRRRPAVKPISHYANCSSSPDGPCIVADRVLMMTNSHAGTHADTPQHFSRLITVRDFDPVHYTGDAVVLDIRQALQLFSPNRRAITRSVLTEAVTHELPAAYRDGARQLWRLLVVTKERPAASLLTSAVDTFIPGHQDTWDRDNAYFEPAAVDYLAETFPNLLLVGIDTPSVDEASFAPIVNGSHGSLLAHGIAILENLSFSHLESRLPASDAGLDGDAHQPRFVEGGLLTVFNPVLSFEDSKGCCVLFMPLAVDPDNQASQ